MTKKTTILSLRAPKGRGNLYVDAYHGFAGLLAGSLQDSSPATHRLVRTSLARLILLLKPTSNVFIYRGLHYR